MAEFVIKLKNNEEEKVFLKKLNLNFKNVNAKNILLDRSLEVHESEKNIYAIVDIKPIIPNIPFYASCVSFFLFFLILSIFNKRITFFLWGGSILMFMAFFWTKYAFYTLLRRSLKKHNINSRLI